MTPTRPRVLFLCTHNSARSQMAEAILRHLAHGTVECASAGTEPSRVHPLAVETVTRVLGADMREQRSKHINEFAGQHFDYVITLCDSARATCPVFPGDPERIHWGFDDPAAVQGSDDDRLTAFRRVAVELERRLQQLLIVINRSAHPSRAQRGDRPWVDAPPQSSSGPPCCSQPSSGPGSRHSASARTTAAWSS